MDLVLAVIFFFLFFGCALWVLWHAGSSLQHLGFSSCGSRACELRGYTVRASLSHDMWDLNSLTRDRIHNHCLRRWILNHWTARKSPFHHCEVVVSINSMSWMSTTTGVRQGLIRDVCRWQSRTPPPLQQCVVHIHHCRKSAFQLEMSKIKKQTEQNYFPSKSTDSSGIQE